MLTKDKEIAELVKSSETEFPFLWPPELLKHETPMFPVVKHEFRWPKQSHDYKSELLILYQSSFPFRRTSQINESIRLFLESMD